MITHKKKGRGILGEIYFFKKNHTHKNTLSLINTLTLKEKKQTIYKKSFSTSQKHTKLMRGRAREINSLFSPNHQ